MNVNLGAPYESKLRRIVEKEYAGNQTEALRQAIDAYTRQLEEEEMMLVERGVRFELQKMEGKKWIPWEEVKKGLKK